MKRLVDFLILAVLLAASTPALPKPQSDNFDLNGPIPVKFYFPKKTQRQWIPPKPDGSENLVMGNPSGATSISGNLNNYLMVKPQYALSYNNSTGEPNWVSWHLNASWIGSSARANDFRADSTLPKGFIQVKPKDDTGLGFDKGHMCNSKDRTRDEDSDKATFLMTNMVPQSPRNNEDTWKGLEEYSRAMAKLGDELYIVSGPAGAGGEGRNGFIATFPVMRRGAEMGRITVPAYTWKVILALPHGKTSSKDVTTDAVTIAVIVPNKQSIDLDWHKYIVSISAVEKLTHYQFFSTVDPNVAAVIKDRVYQP
jgi:endonuclease G